MLVGALNGEIRENFWDTTILHRAAALGVDSQWDCQQHLHITGNMVLQHLKTLSDWQYHIQTPVNVLYRR